MTLDANGVPQIATPSNSIILGQAGQDYHQQFVAGMAARLASNVSQQMTDLHLAHETDPQGFKAAADAYSNGLRNSPGLDPAIGNRLADMASNEGSQRFANISEKVFELDTRTNLQAVQTQISDTQNKMAIIARNGGMGTDGYTQLDGQLKGYYASLSGTKLFGYSQERVDSELATAQSQMKGEAIVGSVDAAFKRTSGDGGRAGAQATLNQGLDDPSLHLSIQERDQFKRQGLAHLDYLTSAQKAQIDGSRLSTEKIYNDVIGNKVDVPDAMINQALAQAQSVGDSESVLKLAQAAAHYPDMKALRGLTSEQRVQAIGSTTAGGGYFGALKQQENNTGDPTAGNGGGDYQFTPSTWATVAAKHPDLNLSPAGRTDPAQQQRAIVAFTNDNKAALTSAGIQPTDANTYMAHFLGAGGATSFIKAMQQDPSQPAAALNLAAATANPNVFYKGGDPTQPRSLSEVYALQTKKFGGGTSPVVAAGPGVPTPQQMQANPYSISVWSDMANANAERDVKSGRAVGEALATQLASGNLPNARTVAGFQQLATRYPQLNDIAQKVNTNWDASVLGGRVSATMSPPAAQAYVDQVNQQSQGADIATQMRAQALQDFVRKGVQNLKEQPFDESNRRGWLQRAPAPIDLTSSEGMAALPQAIADRSTAATVISSHTGQTQLPLAPADLRQLQGGMAALPAPAVQQTIQAIGSLPPQQLDGLMANSEFKQTIMGLARSGDPAKMNTAYSFLDQQYRRNPVAFDADDSGALKGLRSWQALGQFLPPDQVAKRMMASLDPGEQKAREISEKLADKQLEGVDAASLTRGFSAAASIPVVGGAIARVTGPGEPVGNNSPAAGSPMITGQMVKEYGDAYRDLFVETQDPAASSKYAMEKLSNKYSTSDVSGGRVMAYAPDREVTSPDGAGSVGAFYPKVNGSFDWLKDQMRLDVTNTDYFKSLRYADRAQSDNVMHSLTLLSDKTTEADVAAKRPPSYQVLGVGNDGRFHLIQGDGGVAMRFRGDAEMAQQHARDGFAKQRAADLAPGPDEASAGP